MKVGTKMSEQVIIRGAVLLLPGSVRLLVMSKKTYGETRGNGPAKWFEYENLEARAAFRASKITETSRKTAIPATATLGSDKIIDLQIDWSKRFRHRESLLAHWVMGA